MQLVETLKVNANYLSIYNTILDGISDTTETAKINFADTFHDCRMSVGAIKTIKKAVNVILYLARRKHYQEKYKKLSCTGYRKNDLTERAKRESKFMHLCTFVTLTLPAQQTHTDKEITEFCINPFLSYARKYFKVRYYVWKKELQKNGNLHFHFVTDRYIDALCLRRAWNRVINRGKIDGIKEPFNYVDRYHNNQIEFYKDGWNDAKMKAYFAANQNIKEKVDFMCQEIELNEKRQVSFIEYQEIFNNEVTTALERAKALYDNEISKKNPAKRWRNPNSTDIKAVNNPQTVSKYIAKYVSKDIDDNPQIIEYQKQADMIKKCIYETLRKIQELQSNNENIESELETLSRYKEILRKHRLTCPICGRLWFKSATLTPFLAGAKSFVHSQLDNNLNCDKYALDNELKELVKFLTDRGKRENRNLVLYNYELNPDGTENKEKLICLTLLVNIFELQTMYVQGFHCKLLFPEIVRMWQRFVYDCIRENRKKGLYEDFKKDFEEFETIKK